MTNRYVGVFARLEIGEMASPSTPPSAPPSASPSWVVPVVQLELACALASAALLLYRAKRAGKAAFPRSDTFQRATTVFDHSTTGHGAMYYLLALRTISFLWNVAVLAQAYATVPRLACSTHAPCAMLHFDLTSKPSNWAKFTVWNYHLQTAFWLLATIASFRHVLTGNGTRAYSVDSSVACSADAQASHLQAPLAGDNGGAGGSGGGSGDGGGSGGGGSGGSGGGGGTGGGEGCVDALLSVTVPTLLSVCVPFSVLVSGVFW